MSDQTIKAPKFNSTPAVIDFEYEAFKGRVEKYIEDYAMIVTPETLKGAKAACTQMNALVNELDTSRKDAIKYVSAPIKEADDKMKSLIKMIKDGRQETLSQVRVFEQKRLDELRDDLVGRRDRLRAEAKVQAEFYGAALELDDLVKLGNITTAGRATNKACQSVHDRVNQELTLQVAVDLRLLELENAGYRAGLAAPLTRAHVEYFLKADDEVYAQKLQALMDAEVERDRQGREAIERKAKQQADAKTRQQEQDKEDELARKQRMAEQDKQADAVQQDDTQHQSDATYSNYESTPERSEPVRSHDPVTRPSNGGSETFSLTVTMTVTLPAGMSESDIEDQFRQFIEGPGNVRVDFLTATKEQDAA